MTHINNFAIEEVAYLEAVDLPVGVVGRGQLQNIGIISLGNCWKQIGPGRLLASEHAMENEM